MEKRVYHIDRLCIYVIATQCYCYIKTEIVDIKKQTYTF